jgi:hypothetical protein
MKMSNWLSWFVGISVFTMVALWKRDCFRDQAVITGQNYREAQAKRNAFNPSLRELQNPVIKEQQLNLNAALESAQYENANTLGWTDMCSSASLAGMLSLVGMMVMWPLAVDWRRDPKRKELVVEGKVAVAAA